MQKACLQYMRDVLGISEFVSTMEPSQPPPPSRAYSAPRLTFVVAGGLTPEGRDLLTKISIAVGFKNFDLKTTLEEIGLQTEPTVIFSDEQKDVFGGRPNLLVAPGIERLLGFGPEVQQRKRVLWERLKQWMTMTFR